MNEMERVRSLVKETLIAASTKYRTDQIDCFKRALDIESDARAKWVLETLLENAGVANDKKSPLCDDTGIPHLFLELGKNRQLSGEMVAAIHEGVKEGLRELPGRPMAIKGNVIERLEQTGGLDADPGAMVSAPLVMKTIDQDVIKLHVLMQGGGPEIRGKTYRVFHKHSMQVIIDEVVNWAKDAAGKLGCTPCSPAIGIGRSHFEATSLMLEAMVNANFNVQSEVEQEITRRINETGVGPLGIGGRTTALATFLNVGPQRASGVRIVCLRLCCCVEPRVASVLL